MNNKKVNRRDFLRIGGIAGAGAAATSMAGCNIGKVGQKSSKKQKVTTRTLGNTGIEVPIIGLGCVKVDNIGMLRAAYQMGVRYIDTAQGYDKGKNEELIGEWLKEVDRSEVIIATKAWCGKDPEKIKDKDVLLERMEKSFERLGVDYIDVYMIHSVTTAEFATHPNLRAALKELKAKGRIRATGISTHDNMTEVINAAVDCGDYDVITTSYNFFLENDTELEKALQRANDAGIGVVGMKNMGGYFLDEEKKKKVDCHAALKWACSTPLVHTHIPGSYSLESLKENWSVATDYKLTKEDEKKLEIASAEVGMFCLGCHQCLAQCPKRLPIPDIMRSYMYNYGYGHPSKAQETIAGLRLPSNPCGDCSDCTVACKKRFDIKKKIASIMPIQDVSSDYLV